MRLLDGSCCVGPKKDEIRAAVTETLKQSFVKQKSLKFFGFGADG